MPDIDRIAGIATGRIQPATGMEFHFLKVLAGEAIPCSPEENEWVEVWRCHSEAVQDNTTVSQLKEVIEKQTIKIYDLEKRNEDLHRKTFRTNQLETEIRSLLKEVEMLKGFLAACHKTIQKYEPMSPTLVIDHEEEARRAVRRNALLPPTTVVYSSTDGQD